MSKKAPSPPQGYSSDLTVEQYEKLATYLPQKKVTAPRKVSYHAILNGVFYQIKNGCVWADLPKDLPHYKTVFHYFSLWKKTGVWDNMLQ
jgi:transposase